MHLRRGGRRFADGRVDVLVASDAVGMGLNLPIRRVVFSTLRKWAGDAWRDLYDTTEKAVKARGERENTGRTWDLDRSSIFAQIDAFVQRCRDLQEVCEGQTQFARKASGGTTGELPVFGGARGAEVSSQLLAIQTTFEKHVTTLRGLTYEQC